MPTERIAPGEASELSQELIAGNIVIPRLSHGSLECHGVIFIVTCSGNLFDPDNLGHCVHAVVFQGLDKTAYRRLCGKALLVLGVLIDHFKLFACLFDWCFKSCVLKLWSVPAHLCMFCCSSCCSPTFGLILKTTFFSVQRLYVGSLGLLEILE